ncbi:alpha/beta-hydrolase [Coccomyxa subellipsoidea C-169]|uniref:Alpha/beta-hydrolase n=1 Tax=Coccomyxa subellipsoidea (strain C-169) TaxID=574566 RepID=I0YLU5_COCSC|nr:alpha/beta-hydrolase [Coccomyxa subellipsoidea C-169]EIE19364.1 alpha/beta-hydrolase [Coccomyxa subellipsoidea C-169]|eukprot:XP_005643908.1 alpha/beta-hydrolase [Coccomyxa subellipsoidea C-169]
MGAGSERPKANGSITPSFAPVDDAEFRKWFPGLLLSRTSCPHPRWRVVCFPNAGNAEDMYTSEGTGARKVSSPLLEWCRENDAECLAVQPPGRNMRMKEPCITTCRHMAAALLPVLAPKLLDTPYIVIGHSVGTWNAFEFLMLAQSEGVPMPRHVFLSAMAAPNIPTEQRPWRRQHSLSEADFKEECRAWDVNEVLFTPALWPTYHSLMRADFTLFDEYEFTHTGASPFAFPITSFFGTSDRRIKEEMVVRWARFTTGGFECLPIEGHHLWPLVKESKVLWLGAIVERLKRMK